MTQSIAPKHYLNLGAETLKTECFALAQLAVRDCVAREAMGALYGPAGNGKTFAVRSALSKVSDRDVVSVDCQVGMTHRSLSATLLETVTGGIIHRGTRSEFERMLLRELRTRPRVVCLDEAQRLNADGIEILRSLHDDPDTQITLLLVGGNNCWEVLSSQPMLRSRIHRPVEFRPLSQAKVFALLPRFHPLLTNTSTDVLRLVDDKFARGNLRNWANFVLTAESICEKHALDTVTEAVARNAFALLGGRPKAVTA